MIYSFFLSEEKEEFLEGMKTVFFCACTHKKQLADDGAIGSPKDFSVCNIFAEKLSRELNKKSKNSTGLLEIPLENDCFVRII